MEEKEWVFRIEPFISIDKKILFDLKVNNPNHFYNFILTEKTFNQLKIEVNKFKKVKKNENIK